MKRFYIFHIKRYYTDGTTIKHTRVFRTFIEAIDSLRREIADEKSVKDWIENNGPDFIVSAFGTTEEYSVNIDIELGFMNEEP